MSRVTLLQRIVFPLLTLPVGMLPMSPLLAHEIDQAYLESWYQSEKGYWDARIEELRATERENQAAVEHAREEEERAAKSVTTTASRVAQGAEHKAMRTLERIRTRIKEAQSALDVIEALRMSGTRVHLARPSRTEGDVIGVRAAQRGGLEVGTSLNVGDSVETGANGFVELVSTDGTTLELGPGSAMKIASIEENRSIYRLERGLVHVTFRCVGLPQQSCRAFTLATPGLLAEGQAMELTLDVNHTGEERVVVFAGDLELRAAADDAERVAMGPGLMVQKTPDGALHGPFNMKLGWVKRWWE